VQGGETVDMLEVQKLAASLRVAAPLSHRSMPDLKASFTAALASALGIRHEDVVAVHVVEAAEAADGQTRVYKLTYEVVVPDGQMASVLEKATSLSLRGSSSANGFANELRAIWPPTSAISIHDLASPVTFQGLVAARSQAVLGRSFQQALATKRQEPVYEGEATLALPLGTWVLLVGAAIAFTFLGCAGAGLWQFQQKAVSNPPETSSTTVAAEEFAGHLHTLEFCSSMDDELPYVYCAKSRAPGQELVTDLRLDALPDSVCPDFPSIPEDMETPQPRTAIAVKLPGLDLHSEDILIGGGSPVLAVSLVEQMPVLPAAVCLSPQHRNRQDAKKPCALEPVHWSSCPSPRDAALTLASWASCSPRGFESTQPPIPPQEAPSIPAPIPPQEAPMLPQGFVSRQLPTPPQEAPTIPPPIPPQEGPILPQGFVSTQLPTSLKEAPIIIDLDAPAKVVGRSRLDMECL